MDPFILTAGIIAVMALILFFPLKGGHSFVYRPPTTRFHEADAVLARRLLKPGTKAYDSYYAAHPGNQAPDDRSRNAPGLLSANSKQYHAETYAAAHANFEIINFLGKLTHTSPESSPVERTTPLDGRKDVKIANPGKTSRYIRRWLKNTGAHSVGFGPLKESHLYSHKGRGARRGKAIEHLHPNAIAITVEMDHRMMQSAPMGTSVMESSEQYLRSGVLALKLAAYIRELGYEATAHIDGNYEVICPLVAVDAGLGVIGRMGLLMTPRLGPRVRIAVVTTNLPVEYTGANPDRTTIHFCHLCKKCATNCPAAAIPEGPRSGPNTLERWQISSENCYHYWTVSGTDCGRCMTVCPYSHRDNFFHRFIRWGIKNNLVFRHLAVKLDDVFYGRKPSVRAMPEWTEMIEKP